MLFPKKTKSIFFSDHAAFLQKRRSLFLDEQHKIREKIISKSRNFESIFTDFEEESFQKNNNFSIFSQNESKNQASEIVLDKLSIIEEEEKEKEEKMEIEPKNNLTAQKRKLKKYAKIIAYPDYLFEIPSDLTPDEWYIIPKPEGARCLLIAKEGLSFIRDKNGFCIKKFISNFPGGNPKKKRGVTILDVFYDRKKEVCYFLDILFWNDQNLIDCSAEARFFWLDTHAAQIIHDIPEFQINFCKIPRFPCSLIGFNEAYKSNFFNKDGLLFISKKGIYVSGVTPYSLIWKDSFCSLYFSPNQMSETFIAFLQLNKENQMKTLDGFVISKLSKEEVENFQIKRGDIVKIEIKEEAISSITLENFKENSNILLIENIKIIEKVTFKKRALPDSLSKILSTYYVKNNPLTFTNIINYLEKFTNK